MSKDYTSLYLSQLAGMYQLVEFSFTPVGSNLVTLLLPFSRNRVAVFIETSAAGTNKVGIKSSSGLVIPYPKLAVGGDTWITVSNHYSLPLQEIWLNDVFPGALVTAFAIQREEREV